MSNHVLKWSHVVNCNSPNWRQMFGPWFSNCMGNNMISMSIYRQPIKLSILKNPLALYEQYHSIIHFEGSLMLNYSPNWVNPTQPAFHVWFSRPLPRCSLRHCLVEFLLPFLRLSFARHSPLLQRRYPDWCIIIITIVIIIIIIIIVIIIIIIILVVVVVLIIICICSWFALFL